MSNENELLEPLATEAGQQAIARAINNLGSLENAVRAERAAATATQKADEARNSAEDASDYATEARNWANKTDGYVAQETITIPPEQEGDEPTTETIDLYSARYYAALAQDAYNNLQFDTEPTENSTNLLSSGTIYMALNGKADKSDTYTKTEVDTALSNVQSTLTFDSTPTANSNNPVTSGGIYTALQNVNIDIDDEITEDSDNPVKGGAIYTALGNKADKSTTYTKTEVDTAISSKGDVTTNTDQNITGTKTFVGSKKVGFKQSATNDKLGFTLFGNTGTERGYLEFNPQNTIDGVAGLMTLGNYATSAAALTQVGFRRYSNISGQSGAYNLLMPMVADARTPFSLTTSYQNFYLPLGFTDGTTTVKTAKSGVVDLSPLLQAAINNITNANGVSY